MYGNCSYRIISETDSEYTYEAVVDDTIHVYTVKKQPSQKKDDEEAPFYGASSLTSYPPP